MRDAVRRLTLAVAAVALGSMSAYAQDKPDSLPPGVTQEMITEGKSLFNGLGLCMACHGTDAKGIPNLGADLTDEEWQHGDGSFENILKTIAEGVTAEKSSSGTVMPPKGGSTLSDAQLKAVAAYAWSLSRKPQ